MESIAFVESEKRRRVTHGVSIIGHLHLIVYYIYINRRRKILWKSKATKQNSQRRRKSNRSSLCLLTVTTKTKGKKEREWVREREIKRRESWNNTTDNNGFADDAAPFTIHVSFLLFAYPQSLFFRWPKPNFFIQFQGLSLSGSRL